MLHKIFIDGQEGTTGLKIFDRLSARDDIELLPIEAESRKDPASRLERMAEADITFLCLPDEASREIVAAADSSGKKLRIIDTSTAFRTAPGWVYGLPELEPGKRADIASAVRVAGPGCHAAGFILIARPLIQMGIVGSGYQFVCHSMTGYSGGGKKMIAEYEGLRRAPRQYGLPQGHKHLPEMQMASGAGQPIIFNPAVADYYSGMLVTVPLHGLAGDGGSTGDAGLAGGERLGPEGLYRLFSEYYQDCPMVRPVPPSGVPGDGFLEADAFSGRDDLELLFYGSRERPVIAARFDNLGKGASGNAVQCMNLMLGIPETKGLAAGAASGAAARPG
ncbi:MAG: N-acetyl-gamma-glutamyl-phosphate reductase [Clostridiales Family XIII bacterium]|jgi:N-acetyl-gamma-glutamyl-phosphate reductase|nr:N-acetyl-gamma-glutamyl-phosphate reductase [Clostridiales Family XIII bacterium]